MAGFRGYFMIFSLSLQSMAAGFVGSDTDLSHAGTDKVDKHFLDTGMNTIATFSITTASSMEGHGINGSHNGVTSDFANHTGDFWNPPSTSIIAQDNATSGHRGQGEIWLRNFFSIYIEDPSTRLNDPAYMWIRFTFLTIVIPAGVAGNLLTMVVMTRPSLRHHPMSGRFGALAFCDLCCCLIRGITWLRLGFALNGASGPINFDNDHWCRFSEYFFSAIHISEAWVVVYITVERAIFVILPMKGPIICRQSLVKILLPMCLVGPFLVISYLPFITKHRPDIGCATKAYPDMFFHFITATTSVSMVPLTLIFLSNVSIIISLRRQDLKITHSNRSARFRKVTNMVLAVSVAFLSTVFPQAANALMTITNPHWVWLRTSDDVTAMLWDINFAVNFYLYVITGNQVRVELKKLFGCHADVDVKAHAPAAKPKSSEYSGNNVQAS